MGIKFYSILIVFVIYIFAISRNADGFRTDSEKSVIIPEKLFSELLQRVELLESRDKQQHQRITTLELHEKTQNQQIESLRSELDSQTQLSQNLERTVMKLKNKLKSGAVLSSEHRNRIRTDSEMDNASKTTYSLDKKATGNITRRAGNEVIIAFFAALSQSIEHVGAKQSIAFDDVITNIGSAYNAHFGSFVAPVAGVYVFSVTLVGIPHVDAHCTFMRNGVAVSKLYLRGIESPYGAASQTAVLRLDQGDDISIQNVDSDRSFLGSRYSTFSGFLAQEDFTVSSVVG